MKTYIRKSDGTSERYDDVTSIQERNDSLSVTFRGREKPRQYQREDVRELVLHGLVVA